MGSLCSKVCSKSNIQFAQQVDIEFEPQIQNYTSKVDKDFSKLEDKYNLLKDVRINVYMNLLSKFSLENATISENPLPTEKVTYNKNDAFFKVPMPSDEFQSFIENKLFKLTELYTVIGNEETKGSIFQDWFIEMHRSLFKKLQQNDKEKSLPEDSDRVKKFHLIAFGILYASGKNYEKIRLWFDLFQEEGKLKTSSELLDFLLSLFLISSYCILFARNKIGNKVDEIEPLEKDRMKEILDQCELKDSMNLVGVTEKLIFNNSIELTYDQFKMKFNKENNSLGFLISPKGIRNMLEKNNV